MIETLIFFFLKVTENDVKEKLLKLDPFKAAGLHELQANTFKDYLPRSNIYLQHQF